MLLNKKHFIVVRRHAFLSGGGQIAYIKNRPSWLGDKENLCNVKALKQPQMSSRKVLNDTETISVVKIKSIVTIMRNYDGSWVPKCLLCKKKWRVTCPRGHPQYRRPCLILILYLCFDVYI